MLLYPIPVKLIRYLNVWKVTSSLAWLPRCLPVELSFVLGSIIAKRLSTAEATPWLKALQPLTEYHEELPRKKHWERLPIPEVSWPIDASIFVYPGKSAYGKDELIFWELRLLGESADHGNFLELILPAMEEAGYTSEFKKNRRNGLWGHFDIHAVHVARGARWEPLVSEGRLDLRYRATPTQWAEGLAFVPPPKTKYTRLQWLTPFDFDRINGRKDRNESNHFAAAPSLSTLLDALLVRVSRLLPGKHNTIEDVMAAMSEDEQSSLQKALERAPQISLRDSDLQKPPKHWPGNRIGSQTFARLPAPIIRYLELAAILHIGGHTHFGCGTFGLR